MTTYSMDTSFFITSYNDLYPPDVAPGFWEKVEDLGREERVQVSAEVVKELERRDGDEICTWVKERQFLIHATEEDLQVAAGEVQAVQVNEHNPPLVDPDRPESDGDVWVIALALARSLTVVTAEVSAPLAKKKAKIPDVCNGLDVPCIGIVAFMREAGIKLVAG